MRERLQNVKEKVWEKMQEALNKHDCQLVMRYTELLDRVREDESTLTNMEKRVRVHEMSLSNLDLRRPVNE